MFLNTFVIYHQWAIVYPFQDIQIRNFQFIKSISHLDPLHSWIRHTQINKYDLATEYMNMNKFLEQLGKPDNFGSGINTSDPV